MAEQEGIKMPPRELSGVLVAVHGTDAYIAHHMAEKARKQVRDKRAKVATASVREVKDAAAISVEIAGCHYQIAGNENLGPTEGKFGIPTLAFKKAMVNAAHVKKVGVSKVDANTAIFVRGQGCPVTCATLDAREDVVRVQDSLDLRYRPYYFEWQTEIPIEFYPKEISLAQVISLVQRAGDKIGVGDWRPEKSGNIFGRFRVTGAVGMAPDDLPVYYLLTETNDLLEQAKAIARKMGAL